MAYNGTMPIHDPGPAFRALHRPGNPFILANAWDAGSARLLAALGAEAIGTTSSGHAFTLGRADMGRVTRDEALAHAADMVAATPLPVSADLENGHRAAPEEVAETVRLAAEAGLAGCSIEDTALPATEPYPFALAVERVRAAVAAARSLPRDFVVVARADGMDTGCYRMPEALRRLRAFASAGADCVYAPGPPDLAAVREICAQAGAPVNALAAGPFSKCSKAELASAGVARISIGGALARLAQTITLRAAEDIFSRGDFSALGEAAAPCTIEALLQKGARAG